MSYQRGGPRRSGGTDLTRAVVAPGRRTLTEALVQRRAGAPRTAPATVTAATEPSGSDEPALDPYGLHLLAEPSEAAVQARAQRPLPSSDESHATAAAGVRGAGAPLPFLGELQTSFGRHGALLADARAHTDGAAVAAAEAIGAQAYTTGRNIAFAAPPDRELVAHEAAHVVQQAGGVRLKGGIGDVGDAYERHADQVASAFVRGDSAEPLFDQLPGAASTVAVQRKEAAPPSGDGVATNPAPDSTHDLKGAPYEWIAGTYSLWVSREWFQHGPSAARVRELLLALHAHGMLPWVTPDRITRAAGELVVAVNEPVAVVSLEAGVFHELGLPPGTSMIASRAGRGLRAVIAVPEAKAATGDDFPLSLAAKRRLIAVLEGFTGLPLLSGERDAIVDAPLHATLGAGTAMFDVHEPMCDRLFGKAAWDQWLASSSEAPAAPQFDPHVHADADTDSDTNADATHDRSHAGTGADTAADASHDVGAADGKPGGNRQGTADGDARIVTPGGEAGGTIEGEVGGSTYGWVQWVPRATLAFTPRQPTYIVGASVEVAVDWDTSVHAGAASILLPGHCDYAWTLWHGGQPVRGVLGVESHHDRTASLELAGAPGMYEIELTATSKHFKTEGHRFTTRVGLYAVAEEEFQKSAFDAAHVTGLEAAFTRDDKGALHTRPDEHAHTTDQEIAALDMTMSGIDALAQQGKLTGSDRTLLHDRLEQQRDALEAIKDKTKAGTPYIVRGTFVSREDASTISLKLLMHMTRQEVRDGVASYELILHDLTDGEATQHPGRSRWRLDHDAPAKVFRQLEGEALAEMADHFHAHNDYPRGTVHLAAQRLTADDVWESTRDTNNWRKKAEKAVATVGMVGGAVMLVVPGGSVVSTGLLVVTSTAGLASVALELEDRVAKQGGLRFDRRLVMDVLQVAATVLPLGSLSKALAGASAIAKSRFVYSMVTLDAAQGFLIADDTRTLLLLVDANTNVRLATAATAEERDQIIADRDHQVAQIIGGAIVNGSFILVSTVGGIKEIVAHTSAGVPLKVREPIADIVKQGRPAMEEALTHGSFAHGAERIELTATERRYLEHEVAAPAPGAAQPGNESTHADATTPEHDQPAHTRPTQKEMPVVQPPAGGQHEAPPSERTTQPHETVTPDGLPDAAARAQRAEHAKSLQTTVNKLPGAEGIEVIPDDSPAPRAPNQISIQDAKKLLATVTAARRTAVGQKALASLSKDHTRLTMEPGKGSFWDGQRINIDPLASNDPDILAGILAHETHHGRTYNDAVHAGMTREQYIDASLQNEAEAQADFFEHFQQLGNTREAQSQVGAYEYFSAYDQAAQEYRQANPAASPAAVHAHAKQAGIAVLPDVIRTATPSTSQTRFGEVAPGAASTYEELYGRNYDQRAGATSSSANDRGRPTAPGDGAPHNVMPAPPPGSIATPKDEAKPHQRAPDSEATNQGGSSSSSEFAPGGNKASDGSPDGASVVPDSQAPSAKPADTQHAPEAIPRGTELGNRSERLEELARDPDHGGKASAATRREAHVALELEARGALAPPVRRPRPGDGHSGDFVDGREKDWDIKAPKSRSSIIARAKARAAADQRRPPDMDPARRIPGEFEVETLIAQIRKEIAAGEGVIIDAEGLSPADLAELQDAVTAAGLNGQVIYYE